MFLFRLLSYAVFLWGAEAPVASYFFFHPILGKEKFPASFSFKQPGCLQPLSATHSDFAESNLEAGRLCDRAVPRNFPPAMSDDTVESISPDKNSLLRRKPWGRFNHFLLGQGCWVNKGKQRKNLKIGLREWCVHFPPEVQNQFLRTHLLLSKSKGKIACHKDFCLLKSITWNLAWMYLVPMSVL